MPVYVGPNSPSPGTDFEAKSDRIGFPNRSSDPSPASAGDVYFNTTDNVLKVYNGTEWEAAGGGMSASGGNVDALQPGNGFTYHTFTSSGALTVSGSGSLNAHILVVAGGGGGGPSGGGGAGGVVFATSSVLTAGTYPITIGSGGAAGSTGTDSTFSTNLTAKGGGGGGSTGSGSPGGSGGGGGIPGPAGTGIQPTISQSFFATNHGNPGAAPKTPFGGGSGGGASTSGGPVTGGAGIGFPAPADPQYTGSLIGVPSLSPLNGLFGGGGASYYAYAVGMTGGPGGGGDGTTPLGPGSNGVQYSGGGGGGDSTGGYSGGPGIVVVRYVV